MSAQVLIVDDSVSVRAVVRAALNSLGIVTFEAKDGLEGIQEIKSRPDLSLVICDIEMPRLDGFGLLRFVASTQPELPVIILTSNTRPAMVQRAKSMGARTWLTKPLERSRLESAVQQLLANRNRGLA